MLVVLAAFMPWATADAGIVSSSRTGMEGDGVLTLILGLIALPASLLAHWRRWLWLVLVTAGVLTSLIGIVDGIDLLGISNDIATVTIELGLVLTVVGGVVLVVTGLMTRFADAGRGQ